MNKHYILAINPGSTSTKFAVFLNNECIIKKTARHSNKELSIFKDITEQFEFRKNIILKTLKNNNIDIQSIKYIIGRGGLTFPVPSGVYAVNDLMLNHLKNSVNGKHASNLGAIIANDIAKKIPGAVALIADPVVTDELDEVARISGHPIFKNHSIFHALNQKAIAKVHAKTIGKKYEELNLVVVHLGGGISIGAHKKGKVVDVNNALDGEGPLSPERCGTVPNSQLLDLCFSGKYTKAEIYKMLVGNGGYVAHLGTNDGLEVENRVKAGDKQAQLISDALTYQVAKYIGAMSTVLMGEVDAIILTGSLAYNKDLVEDVKNRTRFISQVFVYPGEDELEALAMNALLVARNETLAKEYNPTTK